MRHFTGKYHAPYEHIVEMKKLKQAIQNGEQLKIPAECPVEIKILTTEVIFFIT